ncbi:MAG TPA: histidine triad nucleotide-binding protein [bacterium]|nr:histidine triad nucleotide-binding protein [bacterium]
MDNCLFCRIIKGEVPSKKVYEDGDVLAFEDINPQAPVHILIIPKKHIESVSGIKEEDAAAAGRLLIAAGKIAADRAADKAGYRVVFNTGADAGQAVFHIHAHLLAGRKMAWPPG